MEKLIDKIKERVDKSDVKGNGYFYDFSKNVFTGKMDSMTRSNAAKYAADRGATCKGAVDIDTNFLVVGDQALMKYVEGVKSSKMQKAEDLIQKGIPLEIVGEQDFLRLVKH